MFKTHAHAITALGLFVLIISAYLLMAWSWPAAYIWATYEDLYGEWAQTWSFALACLFSARLAFMPSRYRWFFAVLALACLYVVLEEISWGQRLIGFDTPELLKRYNLQREANLHNLLTGPISTTTKDVIEYLLAGALLLYGALYPLLLKFGWSLAHWFEQKGLAAPPLYLAPFFLTAAWLELAPFGFNEAEVAEILVSASLALMTAHYWFTQRRQLNPYNSPRWAAGTAPRLALVILVMVAVVGSLSVVTTRTLYADAEMRARMDGRIYNGYEKFAKRYSRYGRPEISVLLLERVHRQEPLRTSVMRRLASAYEKMGDKEQFRHYNQKAIDTDLQKYAKNPDSRSTNLSLAYSYRQRGDHENTRRHEQQAYDIARAKVKDNPDSANAAYWLAKAHHFRGERVAALAQYKRAFELKPDSSKYRRAYYSMARQVPDARNEAAEEEQVQPGYNQ